MGDQPFWGRRVAKLGAGPEPIPRKKLTVERLAQAIQEAVTIARQVDVSVQSDDELPDEGKARLRQWSDETALPPLGPRD